MEWVRGRLAPLKAAVLACKGTEPPADVVGHLHDLRGFLHKYLAEKVDGRTDRLGPEDVDEAMGILREISAIPAIGNFYQTTRAALFPTPAAAEQNAHGVVKDAVQGAVGFSVALRVYKGTAEASPSGEEWAIALASLSSSASKLGARLREHLPLSHPHCKHCSKLVTTCEEMLSRGAAYMTKEAQTCSMEMAASVQAQTGKLRKIYGGHGGESWKDGLAPNADLSTVIERAKETLTKAPGPAIKARREAAAKWVEECQGHLQRFCLEDSTEYLLPGMHEVSVAYATEFEAKVLRDMKLHGLSKKRTMQKHLDEYDSRTTNELGSLALPVLYDYAESAKNQ